MHSGTTPPWSDVRGLMFVLLHGTPDSRRALALQLVESGDTAWWSMLAHTVHSVEDWRLRARSLEVLGLAAAAADRQAAETILALVTSHHTETPGCCA